MIKIDNTRLQYLIEGHKDPKGNDYFIFTFDRFQIKLSSMSSVIDLIQNNALGYIKL